MIYSQAALMASPPFLNENDLDLDKERVRMMPLAKFESMLRLIWSSPIFGDSFPSEVSNSRALSQMEAVHPLFMNILRPVLVQGLPLLPMLEVDQLVKHIASVGILSCTAITAGEIANIEQLRGAATLIALVYWADQGMDAGDEVMLETVRLISNDLNMEFPTALAVTAASPTVQARLTALRWIEREVDSLSLPEDRLTLLACGLQETLQNDYRKRTLSRVYGLGREADFWAAHTSEIVEALLATAATVHATAVMYAVYRQTQPLLPALSEIFRDQVVMDVLRGPYNAAIRIFDDFNDRLKDSNHSPEGGEFNINIFNQPELGFLRIFLDRADLREERVIELVLEAFQSDTDASRAYIVQVFKDLVRERLAALPASLWKRYEVFLRLAKRVMETGYISFMSDFESPASL